MNRNKYIIDRNGICECRKHGRIWREGSEFGDRGDKPNNVIDFACEECALAYRSELSNFRLGINTTCLPSVLTPELRNQYIYGMAPSRPYGVRVTSTSTLTESTMNEIFEQMWRDET